MYDYKMSSLKDHREMFNYIRGDDYSKNVFNQIQMIGIDQVQQEQLNHIGGVTVKRERIGDCYELMIDEMVFIVR